MCIWRTSSLVVSVLLVAATGCKVAYVPPNPEGVAWEPPIHEHAFADDGELRATLRSQVVVRLEAAKAGETPANDSGCAGWDRIPLHIPEQGPLRLSLGPCGVGHAFLDREGIHPYSLFCVTPGQAVEFPALEPGDYDLVLRGGDADTLLHVFGVAPEDGDAAKDDTHTPPGIYIEALPAYPPSVVGLPTGVAAFVGYVASASMYAPIEIESMADYVYFFGTPAPEDVLGQAVAQFFENGGGTAYVIPVEGSADAPAADDFTGGADGQAGLQALCVPAPTDVGTIVVPDVQSMPLEDALAVYAAMLESAEELKAFAILDLPQDVTEVSDLDGFTAQLAALSSLEYGAVYFPRIQVTASDGTTPIWMSPGGAMAGVFALTDDTEGVWCAPANVPVTTATALAYDVTDDVQGTYGLTLNPIRDFPGLGILVWGTRTLAGEFSNDYRYVPVRRTVSFIESSIDAALHWAVFQPNDEELWGQISTMLEDFLTVLWQEGALQGAAAADAYQVAVGLGETMTAEDVLNNRLIVEVKVAVAHPAEFIVLQFEQLLAPD